ncbi:MAG: OB-fold domain-containing protein [Coriobacteriales bacterium]|jgi:uncharacterized OB-fold protein|nr:OB-fold domain-containing protein [Coriobacteriales bacterium]
MELNAYKCTECGELHHPRHMVCRACGNRDFEEVELNGEGTVLTWTRVFNLPEGYMVPYLCFAIVKFDDTGLVVSGRIDSDDPQIGMRVKSTVAIVKETEIDHYGFIFEPVD